MLSDVSEPPPLVTAVLAALAGVRNGQAVLVLGTATTLRKALEAGTGVALVNQGPADVVVVLTGPDLPDGLLQTRPGGRLVALAADTGAVERTAALHGLRVLHTEPVGGRVAWSSTLPG